MSVEQNSHPENLKTAPDTSGFVANGSISIDKIFADQSFQQDELNLDDEMLEQIDLLLNKNNIDEQIENEKQAINFLIAQLSSIKSITISKDEKAYDENTKKYYTEFLDLLNKDLFNPELKNLIEDIYNRPNK